MKNRFIFRHHNQNFTIIRTKHLYEKRYDSDYTRDEFLDENRYISIFKKALNEGLTSFRNKGRIVINVPNSKNKIFSILCELNENNEITVITVLRRYDFKFWCSFSNCHNRINIVRNFIVQDLSTKERANKKLDSIQYEFEKTSESYSLNSIMKSFVDRKI